MDDFSTAVSQQLLTLNTVLKCLSQPLQLMFPGIKLPQTTLWSLSICQSFPNNFLVPYFWIWLDIVFSEYGLAEGLVLWKHDPEINVEQSIPCRGREGVCPNWLVTGGTKSDLSSFCRRQNLPPIKRPGMIIATLGHPWYVEPPFLSEEKKWWQHRIWKLTNFQPTGK